MSAEKDRLNISPKRSDPWRRWGPYLSERQWGTVREDYSPSGWSWGAFPHDHARRRTYRWGEDGLQGWTDRQCRLCFAPALWNGKDPILKERLYGLGGHEGNHGEDVKECYYYLDSSPTHSYTKSLYKYPQCEFPYSELREKNMRRTRHENELELADLGVFEDGRYFDIIQETAKRSPEDILWKITAINHGPDAAPLHILPTLWFRNTWSFGERLEDATTKPTLKLETDGSLLLIHHSLGQFRFYCEIPEPHTKQKSPAWLFTENETNDPSVFGTTSENKYFKDGINRCVVDDEQDAVSPDKSGTKAAAHFQFDIPAGEQVVVLCRLHRIGHENGVYALDNALETMEQRQRECDEFYAEIIPTGITEAERLIFRQGYASLLWSKQFYYYDVSRWLTGDSNAAPPPASRLTGRNHTWRSFRARDVITMPDKWEYPWFAAWDLAFQVVPFAKVDPGFAKHQLILLLREWYMHPNGQIPAYEWNFSDVNPPVHAWAVWRVYKISEKKGERDTLFLERAFQKLLLNFTWWVNRKDEHGNNVFSGGFLGLDNIGVFDRSHHLPDESTLHQSDATAWMGVYCLTMLSISLELAQTRPAYEDIATKFFEHFVAITDAINANDENGLWDEEDGFYYDKLVFDNGARVSLRSRSLVGLLPLCAVTVLDFEQLEALPEFRKRMDWFLSKRPELLRYVKIRRCKESNDAKRILLSIPTQDRLIRCLQRMLDPDEFLSDYGIRSLSKYHLENPFVFEHNGVSNSIYYVPGESDSGMFGGNSNWRGPIWFPMNYLLVEALERYHHFYHNSLTVEYPYGSGKRLNFKQISEQISDRLVSLFLPDEKNQRPCFAEKSRYCDVEHWQNLLNFHEYFDGDTGKGLGASHQTGWTALVLRLIRENVDSKDTEGDNTI